MWEGFRLTFHKKERFTASSRGGRYLPQDARLTKNPSPQQTKRPMCCTTVYRFTGLSPSKRICSASGQVTGGSVAAFRTFIHNSAGRFRSRRSVSRDLSSGDEESRYSLCHWAIPCPPQLLEPGETESPAFSRHPGRPPAQDSEKDRGTANDPLPGLPS